MTGAKVDSAGEINPALAHAVRILAKNPALAEIELREVLKSRPEELNATIYLGRALRAQGKFTSAIDVLEILKSAHPRFAVIHYELALAHSELGDQQEAIAGVRRALGIDPKLANAWLVLGDMLFETGDRASADEAYLRHVELSAKAPYIHEAMTALHQNRFKAAETLLRGHLSRLPTDLAASAVLGETMSRMGENEEAAAILANCLERVPSFDVARLNYATVLCRLQLPDDALVETAELLKRDPNDPRFRALRATALNQSGRSAEALHCFETLLADFPDDCMSWAGYGHALRGEGEQERAVRAYRRSMALDPLRGGPWWGLANLKTVRFSKDEMDALGDALARSDLPDDDRIQFHFALAKGLEDELKFEESFAQYTKGNALRFAQLHGGRDELGDRIGLWKSFFTNSFFENRMGMGTPAPDPIFIVGLPRSGSTLIEQILASHSAVEGTAELADLRTLVGRLHAQSNDNPGYPHVLAAMPPAELRVLGDDYLASTRRQRRSGKPLFTDKMPGNFEHIGLITLILPNAKIIDARRHPLGCCLSNFKQHYAQGQHFSYDLTALGRHYADYVELMAHFDTVLPGRVHRVFHEDVVADPEHEIRRLLDYCGLPFEPSCLKFHETKRQVRTVSSEQVRQPIFSDGVDHWRNFEPWLGPLKDALGPVLDAYPEVPAAFRAETARVRN
jgi:tetratricopeptide (TPR) repeat protein